MISGSELTVCAVSAVTGEQVDVQAPPSSRPIPGQQTALHRAAAVGNGAGVAALIQGGCALDLQDRVSGPSLHHHHHPR